jgi:hypothetical protein
MVKEAVRLSDPVGVKVTLIVQALPAASEVPHVVVCPKSPGLAPINAMLLMARAVVPVFLSVMAWAALVVLRFWRLKVRLAGVTLARGALPVPVRYAVCGLLVALSLMENVAVWVPGVLGANAKLNLHVLPAGTELPQVPVTANSPGLAPENAALVMVRAAFPEFLRFRAWDLLVEPTARLPKLRVGSRSTMGPLPVPERLTVWGLLAALSVMVIAAFSAEANVGVNVTLMMQLPPAGTELPQVLV